MACWKWLVSIHVLRLCSDRWLLVYRAFTPMCWIGTDPWFTPPHTTHESPVPTPSARSARCPCLPSLLLLLRSKREQGAEFTSYSDSRLKNENRIFENSREVFFFFLSLLLKINLYKMGEHRNSREVLFVVIITAFVTHIICQSFGLAKQLHW